MQEEFNEHILKQKASKINPMAALHIRLCKAVEGWVPLEEFLEMPFTNMLELIEIDTMAREEMDKEVKKSGRGRKNI